MRKNSTNYTDSVICRKCYHPKQKKMYKNPALFHLTEPLSKDTPARCSGILKHIHGSINFHFFFLQVQPVYVKFFSLNRQPSEFCVKVSPRKANHPSRLSRQNLPVQREQHSWEETEHPAQQVPGHPHALLSTHGYC